MAFDGRYQLIIAIFLIGLQDLARSCCDICQDLARSCCDICHFIKFHCLPL